MAQNETVVAALEAQPVPADRECIRNATDVVKVVQDFVTVNTLASTSAGNPFPNTNNLAQQALTTAMDALSLANDLDSQVKERRFSTNKVALTAGDSLVPISWSPALPSTLYRVEVTFFGDNSAPASTNIRQWHVVDGSETVNSCTLNIGNAKEGEKMTWLVESLE